MNFLQIWSLLFHVLNSFSTPKYSADVTRDCLYYSIKYLQNLREILSKIHSSFEEKGDILTFELIISINHQSATRRWEF